jgi:hypothetical protein
MSTEIERPDKVSAVRRAETIRSGMIGWHEAQVALGEAFEARDWVTLGHKDWDTYCEKEFSEKRLKLTRDEREQAALAFRSAGMSVRAIGSALNVDPKTVRNDLARGGENSPPAAVVGTDGKTYAATKPPTDTPAAEQNDQDALVAEQPGADSSPGNSETDEAPTGDLMDSDSSEGGPHVAASGRSGIGVPEDDGMADPESEPLEPTGNGDGGEPEGEGHRPPLSPSGDMSLTPVDRAEAWLRAVDLLDDIDPDLLGPVAADELLERLSKARDAVVRWTDLVHEWWKAAGQ